MTSSLKTLLEQSVRLFPASCDLGGEGMVDYHILADGGFAQTSWMQRPFVQSEVVNDMVKAHFNECFSSARRIVESVFGIITSRFRIFQRALIGSEENCKLLIMTALVLHNLLAYRIPAHELLRRYPIYMNETVERTPPAADQSRWEAQVQRMRPARYFARRDGYM
ncbi:unnamed protein product [Nippostrongylus brasiliensis]|uniref:DDE Tnp4 domain-containing protein n=1 Tax=Nippostrongylus brasiliensis TaxID=27835 RepID=A0A0N4YXV8_NIPBR|nr:unnamed protein product [Nippostrongylus brasiliensis]